MSSIMRLGKTCQVSYPLKIHRSRRTPAAMRSGASETGWQDIKERTETAEAPTKTIRPRPVRQPMNDNSNRIHPAAERGSVPSTHAEFGITPRPSRKHDSGLSEELGESTRDSGMVPSIGRTSGRGRPMVEDSFGRAVRAETGPGSPFTFRLSSRSYRSHTREVRMQFPAASLAFSRKTVLEPQCRRPMLIEPGIRRQDTELTVSVRRPRGGASRVYSPEVAPLT